MGETPRKRMRFRQVVLATTVLASLFILVAGLALAAWYTREDSVSQTPNLLSAYADVAASGNETGQEYVAVVWSEGPAGENATHAGALKVRWGLQGEGWSWPVMRIEDSNSKSEEPAVAVYSDTAYVAYTKQSGSNWVIAYAECPYGGGCATDTVHTSGEQVGAVDIAFCNDTAHIVWADIHTGGQDDIWHEFWNGTSWTGPTRVSDNLTDDSKPSIACYGDTVHVAWLENDQYVRYKKKESGGWGTKEEVWDGAGTWAPYNTSVAAYGGYADVTWDYDWSGGGYAVGWKRRCPNGSWKNNPVASGQTSDSAAGYTGYLQPANAIYSDTSSLQPVPAVVWHAQEGTTHEVIYKDLTGFSDECDSAASPDTNWSPPITLTHDPGFQLFKYDCSAPSIAIGISDTVTHTHVVFQQIVQGWEGEGKPWEIYYTSDFTGTLTQEEPDHPGVYLPIIMKNHP